MRKPGVVQTAVGLLLPALLSAALLSGSLRGGLSTAQSATTAATPKGGKSPGLVQVSFITSLGGSPPSGLQNVFLNVSEVRINAKPTQGAGFPAENDPGWVTIPVPSGIGNSAKNLPGDLQIDMLNGQGMAQLFNTFGARLNNYHSVEVLLDPNNTGFVVPQCALGSALEGCIAYPLQLQSTTNQLLRVLTQLSVNRNSLSPMLLKLTLNINAKPAGPGGAYIGDVAATTQTVSAFFNNLVGSVSGVQNAVNPIKGRKLAVYAEPAGTNNVVAFAPVVPTGFPSPGNFTFPLPAAPDIGTAYDVFVAGPGVSYDAVRLPAFKPQASAPAPTAGFAITAANLGNITGTVKDFCTGRQIVGATLNLLFSQQGKGTDCTIPANVPDCIVVATTTTDNLGKFPLPGNTLAPSTFNTVPIGTAFGLQVSAPGYDPLLVSAMATAENNGGTCESVACDLTLTTSYLTGNVALASAPPPGTNVLAQVFAEDHGTSKLESSLPMPIFIGSGSQSAPFTLNVPSKVASFDLFASAIDLAQGATDPYPGHTIEVLSGQAPPAACATSTAVLPNMQCVGHGSIFGPASSSTPDSGTTIELSKGGVELMSTTVGPLPPAAAPSQGIGYEFCIPPEGVLEPTYFVQRLQGGSPVASPVGVGPLASPQPTSTPCPSSCSNSSGGVVTCPGICANTAGPNL